MRGLLISSEFPPGPGGIGAHALALARGLSERGWDLSVLTRQDYAGAAEIDSFNRDETYRIEGLSRRRLARPGEARAALARQDPALVIASGATSVWLASLLTGEHRSVAIAHGTELTAGPAGRRSLTRGAFRRMDAAVCVSHHTHQVLQRVGVDLESVRVIANGADASRFRPSDTDTVEATRRELAGAGAGPFLLTVGHVSRRKAQDVVIRALPTLLGRFPDVRYVVAGLPTRREPCERLARELGVADHVIFLGRVADSRLRDLYGACDVFVLVSRSDLGDFEGYGIAAVEAALCGRPTVATLGSGLAEAVLDGETGLLVPADDPAATALALQRLLEKEGLADRLGRAALERARREQTWTRRLDEYDAFLREVAKR